MADLAALDDAARRAATDTGGFWKLLAALPDQTAEAWDAGRAWADGLALPPPRRVVVAGMGGSAIGADMIAALGATRAAMPIEVVRDYDPPPLDADSLLVACSFSGNTEEVLAAFEAAGARGATRVAITTGGKLAECAARAGAPAFTYDAPGPPRTALGYALMPLLALVRRLGVIAAGDDEVARAVDALRACAAASAPGVEAASNLPKRIAARMAGRIPVVVGPGMLRASAARWAGVIPENANQWAFAAELPELNHNLVAGFALPPAAAERLRVILLDGAGAHPRTRRRVAVTADELARAAVPHEVVRVEGTGGLDTLLAAAHLGDWVSYYLALLNAADPFEVAPIGRVKTALAAQGETGG